MTLHLQYLKVTMQDASMLEKGHPRDDLCECKPGRVVRRIQVWDDARHAAVAGASVTMVKQSLEFSERLRGPTGLRESVPSLSWNGLDSVYSVEEMTREAFEEMWANADLVPADWPYGW